MTETKDEIFLSSSEIGIYCRKVASELEEQIIATHKDIPILFIVTLKGAVPFFNKVIQYLSEEVKSRVEVEYIQAKSFNHSNQHTGITQLDELGFSCVDKSIFIFEDILDSYKTIDTILDTLVRQTRSNKLVLQINVVALLAKPTKKFYIGVDFYIGKTISKKAPFLYGFGLDDNQKYRLLPDIYILSK
jgi:hypoxanthine phosphoribosyltransferase